MELSFNDHYYLEESLIVIMQYVCRFGAAVSPLVQTAELSEAIKRRQERFGVVTKDEPKVIHHPLIVQDNTPLQIMGYMKIGVT